MKHSEKIDPDDPSLVKNKFAKLLPPEGLDLLLKLLQYDPDKRITAEEALRHPFLSSLHDEADEPSREPIKLDEFDFEAKKGLTDFNYKCMLYEECLAFHNPHFEMQHMAGGNQTARIQSKPWQVEGCEEEEELEHVNDAGTDWQNTDEEDK